MKKVVNSIMARAIVFSAAIVLSAVYAETGNESIIFGVKVRVGGRYDNVRMCVATPAGVKGGMAADISAFTEFHAGKNVSIHVDLPVMRPILFAAAFRMLQFEPTVAVKFARQLNSSVVLVTGPALGVSLHYGPDYKSEGWGPGRTASFFAAGPMVGAYTGIDFQRAGEKFNFQFGLSPYVTPLFGVNDPAKHRGIVIGVLLDALFRFARQ